MGKGIRKRKEKKRNKGKKGTWKKGTRKLRKVKMKCRSVYLFEEYRIHCPTLNTNKMNKYNYLPKNTRKLIPT